MFLNVYWKWHLLNFIIIVSLPYHPLAPRGIFFNISLWIQSLKASIPSHRSLVHLRFEGCFMKFHRLIFVWGLSMLSCLACHSMPEMPRFHEILSKSSTSTSIMNCHEWLYPTILLMHRSIALINPLLSSCWLRIICNTDLIVIFYQYTLVWKLNWKYIFALICDVFVYLTSVVHDSLLPLFISILRSR